MKIFLFAVAGILATGTVNAWTYTYSTDDAALAKKGEICSSIGHKIVWCLCGNQTPSNPKNVTETCVVGKTFNSSAGCKLQNPTGGLDIYCMHVDNDSDACRDNCGCDETAYGEWETASVGVRIVTREVQRLIHESQYYCEHYVVGQDWGCEANYYSTATTPNSSMTCQVCPSYDGGASYSFIGLSLIGNTSITGCYIPANGALKDSTGTYKYTSDCHYSK